MINKQIKISDFTDKQIQCLECGLALQYYQPTEADLRAAIESK